MINATFGDPVIRCPHELCDWALDIRTMPAMALLVDGEVVPIPVVDRWRGALAVHVAECANDPEPLGGPVPGVNGSHLPEEQG